jgi:hypothetical protein
VAFGIESGVCVCDGSASSLVEEGRVCDSDGDSGWIISPPGEIQETTFL